MSRHIVQQDSFGISLNAFSRMTGIRQGQLIYYCRKGCIEGARFNRTLWQWRIFPPAKLITGRCS